MGEGTTSSSVPHQSCVQRSLFDGLPGIVIGQILSFLHWKEKEILSMTSSLVSEVLKSSMGWTYFENSRNCPSLFNVGPFNCIDEVEKAVVRRFGRHFQNCKLWLDVSDLSDTAVRDTTILQLVSEYCHQLKSLCIVHPSKVTYSQLALCHKSYIAPIQTLVSSRKGECVLEMRRVSFAPVGGTSSSLNSCLNNMIHYNFHQHLTCFDASHGLSSSNDIRPHGTTPAFELVSCVKLKTLKCPIHCLNNFIVRHLLMASLISLYILSDDRASSNRFLDWRKIFLETSSNKKDKFQVHYILLNRSFHASNLCPNPFTRSVVLSDLPHDISASFIHRIVELYGQSLHTLALCNSLWEYPMHFTDWSVIDHTFALIGQHCIRLTNFVSTVPISSSALVNMAATSHSLTDVRIKRENVRLTSSQTQSSFEISMSRLLGTTNWQMGDYWSDIFDIPSVNPMLFSSCKANG